MRIIPRSNRAGLSVLEQWRSSGLALAPTDAAANLGESRSGEFGSRSPGEGSPGLPKPNLRALARTSVEDALADKFADYIKTTNSTISTIVRENEALIVAAERSLVSLQRQVHDLEEELETLAAEKERIVRGSEQHVAELEGLIEKLFAQLKIQNVQLTESNNTVRSLSKEVNGALNEALCEAHKSLDSDAEDHGRSRAQLNWDRPERLSDRRNF